MSQKVTAPEAQAAGHHVDPSCPLALARAQKGTAKSKGQNPSNTFCSISRLLLIINFWRSFFFSCFKSLSNFCFIEKTSV